jgi:hypothetical protein
MKPVELKALSNEEAGALRRLITEMYGVALAWERRPT